MWGLFKKTCPICGMDVKKGESVERFGKLFCCEAHAETYGKKQESEHLHESHGDCCH